LHHGADEPAAEARRDALEIDRDMTPTVRPGCDAVLARCARPEVGRIDKA
jgi:hypothetical protein